MLSIGRFIFELKPTTNQNAMGIFFIVWCLIAVLQLGYWGLVFQRLAWYKAPKNLTAVSFPAVSIVICARNEAANLQKNLESILLQDYPIFEVVVVNDNSSDGSLGVLRVLESQFAHLQVVNIEKKEGKGKKAALTKGIQSAKYSWILLTDADCRPISSSWIRKMSQQAAFNKSAIVLGYGPYEALETWLNRWVRFETIYVAIQYFSFALWKMPYMGVGRNLMYQKALFLQEKGFEQHQHITSGDDDLFVNAVANHKNTTICLDNESFMYSEAPRSWKALYHQKTRHYSSSSSYKLKHKVLLALLSSTHFCFYLGLCIFMVTNVWNYAIIVIFILRTFFLHLVFFKYLEQVKQISFLKYVFILDALLPIYYIIFASSLIGKQDKTWK
ncbi:MAG: N-acetylglucosaminyltransferase (EC [uncultured Aureispira sp.]|uniref:N-acetylglucosaminyltransferase (EC) n=1 Tax=uncultured Aureispira sp. TaxID=1331704 RepID=A0A6S6UE49_9BACT|nr:MAG: N-acetylglucosaminyltransferase (EC [uncultured Aureispira sp.]